MPHVRPLLISLLAAVTLAVGALSVTRVQVASAQAALPYVAYGTGLSRGQVVEALVGGAVVARTTADGAGHWKLLIEPPAASNGDTVAFNVDGAGTGKSVVFQSGRFPAPPGIALGAATSTAPAAQAAPAVTATPSPTPRATPTAKPGCTKNGRPVACARPAPKTPRS